MSGVVDLIALASVRSGSLPRRVDHRPLLDAHLVVVRPGRETPSWRISSLIPVHPHGQPTGYGVEYHVLCGGDQNAVQDIIRHALGIVVVLNRESRIRFPNGFFATAALPDLTIG